MHHLNQPLLLSATLASCLIGVALGEDHADHLAFSDLRIEASLLPDTFDTDARASGALGSVSQSGDVTFDDAWRVGIIGQSARANAAGGLAFGCGGGIQYSRWHDGGDVEQTVEALAATLRLGLVIRPTDFFHLEAMPYGALGAARGKIESEESDVDFYWEFGGIAGAFLTFNSFQVGIHVGYLWNGTKLNFDNDANFTGPVQNVTVDLRGEGAFFGASIGGRF